MVLKLLRTNIAISIHMHSSAKVCGYVRIYKLVRKIDQHFRLLVALQERATGTAVLTTMIDGLPFHVQQIIIWQV